MLDWLASMHFICVIALGLLCVGRTTGVSRNIDCAESRGQYIPVFSDGKDGGNVVLQNALASQTTEDDSNTEVMDAMIQLNGKVDLVNARISLIFAQCKKAGPSVRKETGARDPNSASSGDCEIEDYGMCYWLVTYDSRNVTTLDAWETCATRPGGRPASIVTATHYASVVRLMKSKIRRPRFYSYIWLGLKIDQLTKVVTTADGTRAPFVRWYAKMYPISHSRYTQVYLYSDLTRSSGFMNFDPTRPTNGVMCETMV